MSHDITTICGSSDDGDDEGSDEDTQPEERVAEFLLNAKDHHVNVSSGMQKGINKVLMKALKGRAASQPARAEQRFRAQLATELVWGERVSGVLGLNQQPYVRDVGLESAIQAQRLIVALRRAAGENVGLEGYLLSSRPAGPLEVCSV